MGRTGPLHSDKKNKEFVCGQPALGCLSGESFLDGATPMQALVMVELGM
jgi:hypothetical protein